MNNSNNGIPLQDRMPKDSAADATDHVYEAPPRKKAKKAAVRFGELGMFGANSKRIPWVVYLFSIVQVGVFIGEIVKNGECKIFPPIPHLSKLTLSSSYNDGISYYDSPLLQSYDRTIHLCPD